MADVRHFNPSEPRDPDGQWTGGVPGASAVKDALKLAGRIDLDPDERLVSSSKFSDSNGDRDLLFAVVHGPHENDVRIGLVHPEDAGRWKAANKGGTATLTADELHQFRADIVEANAKSKAAAKANDKAWEAGNPPTDRILRGQDAVAEGRIRTVYADLDWDFYLTDDDPTSWNLEIRTISEQLGESDAIRLDPKKIRALLKHLDAIQAELDDKPAPTRSGETRGGRMGKRAEKPYGDVKYADPGYQQDGKARYPIDTAEHVRAAWSYINQADNAAAYSAKQLANIKRRIQAAAKRLGVEIAEDGRSRPTSMTSLPQKRSGTMSVCVRSFGFQPAETRSDGRTLEGYAAVFGSPTRIAALGGDFDEVIQPGAFARSLKTRMPVLQWDHGKDPAVGTAPIGDIEDLREDDHGLYVRAKLYDHPSVDRVRMAIQGRSVKGMSFRFQVPDGGDRWERRSGNVDLRTVADADVFELGPVAFPAYDTTSVTVRSLLAQLDPDEHRSLIRELAEQLRHAVDLSDLTGASDARSADRGDIDLQPSSGGRSALSPEVRALEAEALHALGVL